MKITLGNYPFSRILGWSNSRYALFTRCKRAYFFTYYGKYATDIPLTKIKFLKELTSIPLEVGNVVHHIAEAFLKRLQKSTSAIDEERFIAYGDTLCRELFQQKTFMETYYKEVELIDLPFARKRIEGTLRSFMGSDIYSWIFMKGLTNREGWLIEPGGYGETRLNGLKAYCKMDFLFPVGDEVYILDWKSGKKDLKKHTTQLLGYAAAIRAENPNLAMEQVIPQIVYLSPERVETFEVPITNERIDDFFETVKQQTEEMYRYCRDIEENIPLPMNEFSETNNDKLCSYCQFRELCDRQSGLPF